MLQGKFCAGNKVVTSSKKTWWTDKAAHWESGGEIVKLARWVSG